MKENKTLKIILIIVLCLFLITMGLVIWTTVKNNSEKEPTILTVTFIGANDEVLKTEEVEKGKTIEQWDPERTDGFLGWFTEAGQPFDFNTKVTENMTLQAEWYDGNDEVVAYLLTFLVDGEFYESLEVPEYETAPQPEDPVKEGYTFIGWYENDTEFDFSQPITGEHTINAVFTQNN